MHQFLQDNNTAFRDLEVQARRSCVRFRNQEMPPGCTPSHGDIGFEISGTPPTAKLFVQMGLQYIGSNSTVREWIQSGVAQFTHFADLKNWIHGPLRQEFNIGRLATAENFVQTAPKIGTATELTDMDTVHKGIGDLHKPLYLDKTILFERLQKRVLGQDHALKGLTAVIARHLARRQPTRPAVVFAVGPSGVGKTRTAEIMAQVLNELDNTSNSYQFLRLDMTEYQEAYRVSQLIGSPQGYIGHGDGSQLLDALRSNSRTLVLFDEIEKAHPAILRVLMNAMDAGRLSTASNSQSGREIDCRYAVFLFTSNLDAKSIIEELESRAAFGDRAIEDDVCRRRLHAGGMAPEIVGRIGHFLVFRPLETQTKAEIIAIAVAEVAAEYGLRVSYVEPSVIIELMRHTHSQNFGVRPERFLIDDLLGNAFAKAAQYGTNPVKVSGPPYKCQVVQY